MALLKKRNPAETEPAPEATEAAGSPAVRPATGKGRPTPKRAAARAARPRGAGPVGASTKGKEGRTRIRAERRRVSQEYRAAMMSGDVSKLPERERAKERVLARDFVDTRFNVGPFFLITAAIYFVGGLMPVWYVRLAAVWLMVLGIVAVVVDSAVLARQVTRRVAEKYPDSRVRVRAYSVQRALLPRRWRMPRPRVSRRS
jgi:Protein of unknown function (DUF3043)